MAAFALSQEAMGLQFSAQTMDLTSGVVRKKLRM
jgi:hypothetical protein